MTEQEPQDDKLFEEALDLIIRLQSDPTNPVARELVQRWRARGPEHEAAWVEVAEIHGMAGQVLDDRRKTERAKLGVSRRTVISGGFAGLAVLGAGALYGPDVLVGLRADYKTTTAEVRNVVLPDNTVVTLGPDSAIQTNFMPSLRRIRLLSGMAFFDVAKDSARPFQAIVDDMTSTALGTAFDISKDAGFLNVSVHDGVIEVAAPNSALARGEKLAQGQWLALNERTHAIERGQREKGQIAAWRNGLIVSERETISSVVARIARWQRGRIVIADPRFGAERISGVFDLRDPVTALEAVIHPYGGKVRQLSPWLTIVSPI
ncbi:MAG: FecR domain-containing protein [Xanthobacteraceae bacterium]